MSTPLFPTQKHPEYRESQVRRFLSVLFMIRAKRHLKTLATLYKWTPEYLATMEARFVQQSRFTPVFENRSLDVS